MSNPVGQRFRSDEPLAEYVEVVEVEEQVEEAGYQFEQEIGGTNKETLATINNCATISCAKGDQSNGFGKEALGDTAAPHVDGKDDTVVPKVGMKFATTEELYEFYREYAQSQGFPIRVGSTKKGADGRLHYYYLECSRAGNRKSKSTDPLNPGPTGQTNCQAKIRTVSDVRGVWRISKVKFEHNHSMSPTKSRLYSCNRRLDPLTKKQLDMNDRAGIRVSKTFEAAAIDAGGYENVTYLAKDCINYVAKARQLRLGEGDAAALLAYFRRMQKQCPGFYYDIELDEEGRLQNVFWADSRSREVYKEFGDVVSFDTTYLVNKYQMSFAPFVGVNHHGHSILLGCGLLAAEDATSFAWLFSTWLDCMGGKAPSGIITDQDLAMKVAIPKVFPNTKHRWCAWHVMKKLPEKFGGRADKDDVIGDIKAAVYNSQFEDEFEEAWEELLEKYQLGDNRWCIDMYPERARWVPCYFKTSFWARMSTTQRSESINAFFDGYVDSKTSLKQFVEQYDRAVQSKIEKEVQADHKSSSAIVRCATHFGIEKQFQQAYTNKKFQEVRKELTAISYCRIDRTEHDHPGSICHVYEQVALGDDYWKRKEFLVSFVKEDLLISCSCNLFEFRGIVCRHALKVLIDLDIHQVHGRYVLRRWRKDVHRPYSKITVGDSGWARTPDKERQDKLLSIAARMCELISVDKEYSESVMELMEQKMMDFLMTHPSVVGGRHSVNMIGHSDSATWCGATTSAILDPPLVTRKGAPKKNRLKGALEKMPKKRRVSSKKNATSTPQTTPMEQRPFHVLPVTNQPRLPMPSPKVQGSVFSPSIFQMHSYDQLSPSLHGATQDRQDQSQWRHQLDGVGNEE